MASQPLVAILDGGKIRLLPTSAHDSSLREALTNAIEAGRHDSGRESMQNCWSAPDTQYVVVPIHEMKGHLLLMGGDNFYKCAVQECSQHETAFEDWMHFLRLVPDLPVKLSERAAELSEDRIQSLLDVMMDIDPFEPIEARVDSKNAEMRAEFLKDFPVLDSAGVHKLAGLKGANTSQTVNTWRQNGRILGLPFQGKNAYPVFQFTADGQPLALMEQVLAALPKSFTPWQRAFWFVSQKESLDGNTPAEVLRVGDNRVIQTARTAGDLVAG